MVDAATWESVAAIIEGDLLAKGVKAEVVGIRDGVVSVACDSAEVVLVRYDTQRLGTLVAKAHPEIKRVSIIGRQAPPL